MFEKCKKFMFMDKESTKHPPHLNVGKNSVNEKKLNDKSDLNTKKRTLSLHVAAYENSFENASASSEFDGDKENGTKSKNLKEIFTSSVSNIQNPFEFPTQQIDKNQSNPEVSQFKTSQHLLNPIGSSILQRRLYQHPGSIGQSLQNQNCNPNLLSQQQQLSLASDKNMQQPSTINHQQEQQQQELLSPRMSLVASTRQYSIGMGGIDLRPNSRLWIESIEDSKLVHFYGLEESNEEKDIFFCRNCKHFNITTRCEILHPDGGVAVLWEDRTHLPSCTRQKIDVEKYLQYFEKPIVAAVPKKRVSTGKRPRSKADEEDEDYIPTPSSTRGRPRSRADDTPTSRSRSQLYSIPTTKTATPKSDGLTTEKYRGRKPNMSAMSVVPKTHYKLKNAPNGVVNEGTKLFIFTDLVKNLGREYSYGVAFEGGVLFYCDNCLHFTRDLTRGRQKRKAFYKVINGKIVIRKANHYTTCRPFELRHIFNAKEEESGNNNNDVDDESKSNNVENESVCDSHTPETTIEYDSTSAPSPDISEQSRKIQKQRTRTIETHAKVTAAVDLKSRAASTFRPVYNTPDIAASALPQPLRRTSDASEYAPTSTSSNNIQQKPIVEIIPTRPLPPIPTYFLPHILPQTQTLLYNIPSSAQMREIASKFGYPFSYKCYQFWSSTLSSISEIKGISKPTQTHSISLFDEFACLSLFLTGTEEYGKHIQVGIKEYFFNTYYSDNGFTLPTDISQHTLITNSLTDIHFSMLSKMINCSIAIFNGENIEIFGLTGDERNPVMLLKKSENKFEPVLAISL